MDARRLLISLEPIVDIVPRLAALHVYPGSRAEADSRLKIGRYAWEMASLKIAFAHDHLGTWRRVIADARVVPNFSQYSLLRTALETSCVARWIVDPKAKQTDRFRRGASVQADDLTERKRFEDAGKRHRSHVEPIPPGQPASVRLQEVLDVLAGHKMKPMDVEFMRCCLTYGTPPEAKRGTGEILYRLLSAATHGYQWFVLPTSTHEYWGEGGVDSHTRRITANAEYTERTTALVVDVFLTALTEVEEYVGAPAA